MKKSIGEKYKEVETSIYDILDEYKPDYTIFNEDEDKIHNLKKIIFEKLSEADRRIILEYAELASTRDCAKLFKVSPTTIYLKIKEIQNKIKSYLEDEHDS